MLSKVYMKEEGIKCTRNAALSRFFFFILFYIFFVYVRYEFSDMAKRGERESPPPPSYSVASVVFVNKLSIAPLLVLVRRRRASTKSCKTGQYYID